MVMVVCRCLPRVLGVCLAVLWMVFRVVQGIGCEDHAVLVGVYQAEVVATSLGVHFTDPCRLYPGYRRLMLVHIWCFLVLPQS